MEAIQFDAGHDRNGNPRRCFVVFDGFGSIVDVIDEGYRGHHALTKVWPNVFYEGTRIVTTPGEYRALLRDCANPAARPGAESLAEFTKGTGQ